MWRKWRSNFSKLRPRIHIINYMRTGAAAYDRQNAHRSRRVICFQMLSNLDSFHARISRHIPPKRWLPSYLDFLGGTICLQCLQGRPTCVRALCSTHRRSGYPAIPQKTGVGHLSYLAVFFIGSPFLVPDRQHRIQKRISTHRTSLPSVQQKSSRRRDLRL